MSKSIKNKPAIIVANPTFAFVRPDEVAECWNGVSAIEGLYDALWATVASFTGPTPEESEEPVIGLNCVADFWERFSEDHQTALNTLADAQDAEGEQPEGEQTEEPVPAPAPEERKLNLSEAVAKSWTDDSINDFGLTIKEERTLRHSVAVRVAVDGDDRSSEANYPSVPAALRAFHLRPKDRANSVPAGSGYLPVSKEQKLRRDLVVADRANPGAEINRHGFIFRLVPEAG